MTLKEMRKREREEMSSLRYKMNRFGRPIFFVMILAAIAMVLVVLELAKNPLWCLLPVAVAVLLAITFLGVSLSIQKKEIETELSRWAYVFNKQVPFEGETLGTDDPETGISYVLSERGIKAILPIKREQVFVEAQDNEYFIPWSDVEIVVATDNFARRVRLAAAVIDVSKRSVDGEYVPTDSEIHFLPLEEELVGFFQKHGLEKRISVEWRYIQKEPVDAFKQILTKGYISTLKNESGKRIRRENADDLYKD